MKTIFTHNSDGSTICEAIVDGITYRGVARLNPKDKEFQSDKIGEEIAHSRLIIKLLKQKRNELNLRLNTIKSFYSSYKHTNDFSAKCLAEIATYEFSLECVKQMIRDSEESLKSYIKAKEDLHEKFIKIRSDKTEEEA